LVKTTTLQAVGDLTEAVEGNIRKIPRTEQEEDSGPIDLMEVNKCHTESQYQQMNRNSMVVNDDNTKIDLNPWTLIETYKILENKEAEQKGQHVSEARKQKMANALNDQVKLKQANTNVEKAEDAKFVEMQRNEQRKWEEEQKLLAIHERKKAEQLKKVRQDQIEESVRRRERQRKTQRAEELRAIQVFSKALEKEEGDRCRVRQKEKEHWDLLKEENAGKLEERHKKAKEEQNMDAKLMADIKQKMDKEEAKRAEAVQNRSKNLEMKTQILSECGTFDKRKEVRTLEKKLLLATQEREKAQIIMDKKKKETLRAKLKDVTKSNERLVGEKRRQEKMIEEENEAYAAQCFKEVESVKKEEEIKIAKQKETQVQYRQLLEAQVQQKQQLGPERDGMTDVERSINKNIIIDAESFLKDRKHLMDQGSAECLSSHSLG